MEGTQCKLGARLSDGLCCDDSDNLSFLNHSASRKVASVAFRADTLAGLAREHGTDFYLLDRQMVDQVGGGLANLLAGLDDQLACERIEYVVDGSTSKDSLSERLHDLVLVLDGCRDKSPEGAAVLFRDDDIV